MLFYGHKLAQTLAFAVVLLVAFCGFLAAVPVPLVRGCNGCNFMQLAWGSVGFGNGQLSAPRVVAVIIAVGSSGDMYVVNTVVNRVEKFTGTGTYLTHWRCAAPNPSACLAGYGSGQFAILATASIAPILRAGRMAPMDKELSDVAETYLETVYGLRENDGLTRTGEIAEALGVTPSAVTTTVARLASRGLVRRKAYRAVELTSRGEAVALRILRRHRLAERLLTDVLGIKWSEVHEPASRLSHAMTEDLTNAVDRLLKNPKTCPHGNPIPTSTGKIKQVRAEPLNQLTAGQKGIFTSIWEERRDVLRYLDSLGLIPGVSIRVVDACPFNGPIIVKVHGSRHALGQEVASSIRVSRT